MVLYGENTNIYGMFYPRVTYSDGFIWGNYNQARWIFLHVENQPRFRHCRMFADETVHIFNCTKIPLKFALNKLSETNGISNPSLVMTLQQFRVSTESCKRKISILNVFSASSNTSKKLEIRCCCWCLNKFK